MIFLKLLAFLMRHKHETQKTSQDFFTYSETQFQTKVQQIQVDNEGELIFMRNFFELMLSFTNALVSTHHNKWCCTKKTLSSSWGS